MVSIFIILFNYLLVMYCLFLIIYLLHRFNFILYFILFYLIITYNNPESQNIKSILKKFLYAKISYLG